MSKTKTNLGKSARKNYYDECMRGTNPIRRKFPIRRGNWENSVKFDDFRCIHEPERISEIVTVCAKCGTVL